MPISTPLPEAHEPRRAPHQHAGGAAADLLADREGAQHLAWLTSKASLGHEQSYQYLLVLRYVLLNILGFALLGAAHLHGLVDRVIVSDKTYLSAVIFFIFLGGLGLCAQKVWQTSRELNQLKSLNPLKASKAAEYLARVRGRDATSRAMIAGALRLKLSQRVAIVRHVAGSLVLLGLIGTVVGFIIALSGVHPEQASDVKAITPMVSTLIEGMSTALYTTLVGSVLNVWLMINYHLLVGGTVKLISGLIELGEDHAPA